MVRGAGFGTRDTVKGMVPGHICIVKGSFDQGSFDQVSYSKVSSDKVSFHEVCFTQGKTGA